MGNMSWSVRDEKLQVEWTAVTSLCDGLHLSEYLLEWVNIPQLQTDWQRVSSSVTNTTIRGTNSIFSEDLLANKLTHMESVHIYFNLLIIGGASAG